MSGFWIGVIVSIVTSAAVNELTDISPWLAERVVRQAARLRGWVCDDPDQAEVYREEWPGEIRQRPGKLIKLAVALGYLFAAFGDLPGRGLRRIRTGRRQSRRRQEQTPVVVDPRLEKLWRNYHDECRPLRRLAALSGGVLALSGSVSFDQPVQPIQKIFTLTGVLGMIVALNGLGQASKELFKGLSNLPGPRGSLPAGAASRLILERILAALRRVRQRIRRLLRAVRVVAYWMVFEMMWT